MLERERVTQRLLHGLEVQSRRLVQQRRCAEAVEAAMVAASVDPLRESAQRTLIEAYLAEATGPRPAAASRCTGRWCAAILASSPARR